MLWRALIFYDLQNFLCLPKMMSILLLVLLFVLMAVRLWLIDIIYFEEMKNAFDLKSFVIYTDFGKIMKIGFMGL
jgi:hypothetical protein